MAMLRLAPPWIKYVNEVTQLFRKDSEVHVVYDNDETLLKLYVDDPVKADALGELMPTEMEFGDVTLKIEIVPGNKGGLSNRNGLNLFEIVFNGNAAFAFTQVVHGIFQNDLTYVVFVNEVVQYFNDDLGDIYGQCSTLYQELAKNVFIPLEGVFFCTDKPSTAIAVRADYANMHCEWP